MSAPLLTVSDLTCHYGRICAVRGIDLSVYQGEVVALVGANGAGKTTLLRAISGVLPLSGGKIVFASMEISALRADLRVKMGVGHCPEGRQVFGALSIEDNLRLGAYTQPKQHWRSDLAKVFELFPLLKEQRTALAGTLSGGQQQMLALGRALMCRPRLLLLDEPSLGLAPLLVDEVFKVIRQLKSAGATILLVEQNAHAALAIAERGYVLETGTVALTGSGHELLRHPAVQSAYLGV